MKYLLRKCDILALPMRYIFPLEKCGGVKPMVSHSKGLVALPLDGINGY